MAQHTTIAPALAVEDPVAGTTTECRHHWVIQPADGPISNGSCRICGESREFKNYVESATWGDSRVTNKDSSASASAASTSDDEDTPDDSGPGDEVESQS